MTQNEQQPAAEVLESFRQAMRHVAATVYAITAGSGERKQGILATAVSSLSFDPPSLLVCINRSASLYETLAATETFAVNVLGLGNRDVAERFMLEKGEGRFADAEWGEHYNVPVLRNAQSSFICRRVDCHDFGTHSIFIGQIIEANHRDDAAPLTYYDRHYIDISEAPESCV